MDRKARLAPVFELAFAARDDPHLWADAHEGGEKSGWYDLLPREAGGSGGVVQCFSATARRPSRGPPSLRDHRGAVEDGGANHRVSQG